MNFNKKYVRRLKNTNYKLGDIVEWSSHSPKGTTYKKGHIVAVIDPFQDASLVFNDWSKYHLSINYGTARAVRSYLVSVEVPAKRQRKPKLYFPFSNLLRKV